MSAVNHRDASTTIKHNIADLQQTHDVQQLTIPHVTKPYQNTMIEPWFGYGSTMVNYGKTVW